MINQNTTIIENFCKILKPNWNAHYIFYDEQKQTHHIVYCREVHDEIEYDVSFNTLNITIKEMKKNDINSILELFDFIENTKTIECEKLEEIKDISQQYFDENEDWENVKNALDKIYFKDKTPNRRILDIINTLGEEVTLCFNIEGMSDELQKIIKDKCNKLEIKNLDFK